MKHQMASRKLRPLKRDIVIRKGELKICLWHWKWRIIIDGCLKRTNKNRDGHLEGITATIQKNKWTIRLN